jgi:hypothetical protein
MVGSGQQSTPLASSREKRGRVSWVPVGVCRARHAEAGGPSDTADLNGCGGRRTQALFGSLRVPRVGSRFDQPMLSHEFVEQASNFFVVGVRGCCLCRDSFCYVT